MNCFKKAFAFSCAICVTAFMLCGSAWGGNQQWWGNGAYTFRKVHITTKNYDKCVELDSWKDNEGSGIEVKTKDYGSLFLSEGTYILCQDKCPLCD